MVYQAERTLADYGDKVDSELKLDLEGKISTVKDILENDPENIESLRPAYQELTNTLSQVGASMYDETGGAVPEDDIPTGAEGEEEAETADDEATVEGEYREVNT